MELCNRREESGYSTFKKRIRKTTYQSSNLKLDRPSLAMTEFAVYYLRELAPRELGRIDMYWASSMCHESYISPCTLMVALMYARRLKVKNPKYLETVPSSNLLLVSMMVASKFLVEVDETTLEEWMKASCMESDDLYMLEMEFLCAIDWDLFVNKEDFWDFLLQLEQRIAWQQYLNRNENFFTYTDLQVLSQSKEGAIWNPFIKMCLDILKVLITFTTAYAVAAFTLASVPLLPRTSFIANLGVCISTLEPIPQLVTKPNPVILGMTDHNPLVKEREHLDVKPTVGVASIRAQKLECCSYHNLMLPKMWTNVSSRSAKKNCSKVRSPIDVTSSLHSMQAHLVFHKSYPLS